MSERDRATLFLATSNPGKRAELALLLPSSIDVLSLVDLPVALPPEDGATFAENAAGKAIAASRATGLLALADDSGLEVDALGGAPGVRSARFSGDPPDDERNRRHLLRALASVPADRRAAWFRCAIALARDGHVVATTDGTCEGAIAVTSRGAHGFGYDPVFELPDGRTMAELSPDEKNRISHRMHAVAAIAPVLIAEFAARARTETS